MNILAQLVSRGGDLTGMLYQLLILMAVVVIVGIVFKYLNVRQYIPDVVFQILVVILVVGFALWALRTFL